jgi:hypothetical protein
MDDLLLGLRIWKVGGGVGVSPRCRAVHFEYSTVRSKSRVVRGNMGEYYGLRSYRVLTRIVKSRITSPPQFRLPNELLLPRVLRSLSHVSKYYGNVFRAYKEGGALTATLRRKMGSQYLDFDKAPHATLRLATAISYLYARWLLPYTSNSLLRKVLDSIVPCCYIE